MNTIGFLGGGNMGRAIMEGLLKAGVYTAEEIFVYDVTQATLDKLQAELGIQPVHSSREIADKAQTILVSVKPYVVGSLLEEMKTAIRPEQIIISIAAGISLEQLAGFLSPENKLVRVMPNTPAMVGEGMSAISANDQLTEAEKDQVLAIFNSFGKACFVTENLMDAVVGISGSGPAYVYLFIEALADGGVLEGMPRQDAYEFAAQTVLGAAKMVLETGRHPGDLKDMVCSPGGTTIEGVKILEERGFRGAVMDTVHGVAEKNREMSE